MEPPGVLLKVKAENASGRFASPCGSFENNQIILFNNITLFQEITFLQLQIIVFSLKCLSVQLIRYLVPPLMKNMKIIIKLAYFSPN